MYGVVTRNEEELMWPEFDYGFYEVKDVTGRTTNPVEPGTNMISCFGDNKAAEADSSLVPVNDADELATRDRSYFDWDYICPSRDRYQEQLIEIIDDVASVNPDVRLDDIGFPRREYCVCDVCQEKFAESSHDDWFEWRSSIITDFVETAVEHIPGRVYLTLYPDPYPGHLYKRTGINIDAITPYVDEFVIPLYDLSYSTTYWLEIIASGFQTRIDNPISIELYAVNIETDNLVHATEVAQEYAKCVFFAYDAETARNTIETISHKDGTRE